MYVHGRWLLMSVVDGGATAGAGASPSAAQDAPSPPEDTQATGGTLNADFWISRRRSRRGGLISRSVTDAQPSRTSTLEPRRFTRPRHELATTSCRKPSYDDSPEVVNRMPAVFPGWRSASSSPFGPLPASAAGGRTSRT